MKILYRIGAAITVPFVDASAVANTLQGNTLQDVLSGTSNSVLNFLNMRKVARFQNNTKIATVDVRAFVGAFVMNAGYVTAQIGNDTRNVL